MLGLPISSFVVFIVLPLLVVLVMFYYSWRIGAGKDD